MSDLCIKSLELFRLILRQFIYTIYIITKDKRKAKEEKIMSIDVVGNSNGTGCNGGGLVLGFSLSVLYINFSPLGVHWWGRKARSTRSTSVTVITVKQ